MKTQLIARILLAAILITLISASPDFLTGNMQPMTNYFWNGLSNLLICAVLGIYVLNAAYTGWKLVFHTAVIYYVIGFFNILIEALIFNVTNQSETLTALFAGIPFSAMVAFLLTYGSGRFTDGLVHDLRYEIRSFARWLGKISGGNFIYFPFYVAAGMFLEAYAPGFQEFYGDKIPPIHLVVILNVFFRGFVFAGIAVLIDRTMIMNKWSKALFIGLFFSVIGGIAPLIPVNEFMPQDIRLAHGFEVGISNFIYGVCCFLIVRSRPLTAQLAS